MAAPTGLALPRTGFSALASAVVVALAFAVAPALVVTIGVPAAMPAHAADDAPSASSPLWQGRPPAGEPLDVGRERRLLDERRQIDGRVRTLDRQLESWQSDRLRSPGPLPGGVRGPGDPDDPVMQRRELERRDLEGRRRMIDDRLRRDGR